MKRKQIYAEIISLNLQSKVKEKYGYNYTNCRNSELLEIIDAAKNKITENKCASGHCETGVSKKFTTLVNILKERHLLLPSDVEKIMNKKIR